MPLCLTPFIASLSIKTTALDIRKFDLNYVDPDPTIGDWGWAQRIFIAEIERQYNAGLPVRALVLKARQLGISTATEAVLFLWNFLFPGSTGLVLTQHDKISQKIFNMTKLYWERWPHRYLFDLKYGTRRQMTWNFGNGLISEMTVATATTKEGERGGTLFALHGSEVSIWPDPATLWTGLNNCIPRRHKTIVILESTANGVGNWWHDKWLEAEQGENEFTPMFFPWFHHPAYRVRHSLTRLDLDDDERQIFAIARTPSAYLPGVKPLTEDELFAAIAWRRLEIPRQGGTDNFMQEFPSTPEEAFIVSGRPIFSARSVQDCYEEQKGVSGEFYRNGRGDVEFLVNPSGKWTLFKKPCAEPRSDMYMVGGDPSRTVYGDPGCIQVINRMWGEQVAVWNGHKIPHEFAQEMMMAGDFYHHAMLCPEVEGGGQGVISTILASNYGNVWLQKWADRIKTSMSLYGWSTSYQRKRWAIGILQKYLAAGDLLLHDKKTVHELIYFTENEDGVLGNSGQAKHDDTVMALAIAVIASYTEGSVVPSSSQSSFTPDIYTTEFEDNVVDMMARVRR